MEDDEKKTIPIIPLDEIHIKVMSDSICIFAKADVAGALFEIIFMCLDFQCRMIEHNPPILLRGAITKGKLYYNGDVLFGPGFIKAYLMEENNAHEPRIIITRSILDEYNSKNKEYSIPEDTILVRDYDAFYYVNYIAAYGFTNRKKRGKYDELYEYIESVLDSTNDESIRRKFLYLESKVVSCLNDEQYNSCCGNTTGEIRDVGKH